MEFKDKIAVITGGAHGIDGGMIRQMIYHEEHGCSYAGGGEK